MDILSLFDPFVHSSFFPINLLFLILKKNPSWRVMRKEDQESIFHLLIQCDFARHLWSKVFSEFGVIMELSNDLKDLFQGSLDACRTKKIKVLWVSVVWAVLWGIWR